MSTKGNMFNELDNSLLPWLGKTMKHIDLFINQTLAENACELTKQQVIMLKVLYNQGPQAQHNLAFLTDRDKTSLTRLINGLEKKEMVSRSSHPQDKRVKIVELTSKGTSALKAVVPILKNAFTQLEQNISSSEKEVVISVMKKLQNNLDIHEASNCLEQ